MSLFDKIISAANSLGQQAGEGGPALTDGLVNLLKKDGLSGMLEQFKTKGLGEIASSWVGKGPNAIISTDQIRAALGSERLKELALRAGVSEENAAQFLQQTLPNLIDRLSPDGALPKEDAGADSQTPPG